MNALLAPLARLSARVSMRDQKSSALWNPTHWGAGIDAAGHMTFDGVDLSRLVDDAESPLLAVSRSKLLADAKSFTDALRRAAPDGLAAFSYKTNCIPGVLSELHDAGMGAEVISPYELWLAEKLRVSPDRIIVNGVNKTHGFLEHAVRLGVASINIDHGTELEALTEITRRLGRRARVSLRLKVDRTSHFGLDPDTGEAVEAAKTIAARADAFEFAGLHFHALADNDDPVRHIAQLIRVLAFARHIKALTGLPVINLNVGGGYTVPTMKVMTRFEYARQRLLGVPACPPDPQAGVDIESYMARLTEALDDYCSTKGLPRPRLIFEPGRIVTSQSHILLTKVHAIKPGAAGADFAMTDAGKVLTSYPCDYEYHQMFVANRMQAPRDTAYHLMGRLCTSADWLAKWRCLPRLQRGDVIAIMDAGAYFTSYASNFAFPRPEVVMLDRGSCTTLRQRESFEHLTAMDTTGALDHRSPPRPALAGKTA